nr:MAG TPA: hypothetical protein [Bacteriophage sp.]
MILKIQNIINLKKIYMIIQKLIKKLQILLKNKKYII